MGLREATELLMRTPRDVLGDNYGLEMSGDLPRRKQNGGQSYRSAGTTFLTLLLAARLRVTSSFLGLLLLNVLARS